MFESLIAAIYLDCDRNLNFVWKIVYRFLENEISKMVKYIIDTNLAIGQVSTAYNKIINVLIKLTSEYV